MTETMLFELAKQIPSLGVLVMLVVLFLKHLTTEGAANRSSRHEHNVATNAALQNQTTTLSRLTEAIIELRHDPRPRRKPTNASQH